MSDISENGLLQALNRLESEVAKSQITTGPGSSQGNMTDMHQEKYGDEWADGISPGGTNYNGRGTSARKGAAETREERSEEEEGEPDEQEDDDEQKSLPASGEPLRTSKPAGSAQSIHPGEMSKAEPITGQIVHDAFGQPAAMSPKDQKIAQVRARDNANSSSSGSSGGGTRRVASPTRSDSSAPSYHPSNQPGMTSSSDAPQSEVFRNASKAGPAGMMPSVGTGAPGTTGKPIGGGRGGGRAAPSLSRSIEIEEDGELTRGLEVSEFLFYLSKSIQDSMFDMEQRMLHRISAHHESRGDFARSLAEAVANIDLSLNGHEMDLYEEESAPAYAAKSVVSQQESQMQSLQKSLADGVEMRKSILDELEDLVQKSDGRVSALDIIKFEQTGDPNQLRPEVLALIKSVR